jgi:uncharacterized damage-inducible protein DinB
MPEQDSPMHRYAASVSGELFTRLSDHMVSLSAFLAAIPEEKSGYAYAPDKWTVRQVAGHIWVSHRIFVTRAVAIARGETQPLPGYDENLYARGWPSADVGIGEIAAAYTAEAKATQIWLLMLEEEDLAREGVANHIAVTPDRLLRALIGHESHHRKILIERYGIAPAPEASSEPAEL